jgi:pilus assembly protein Flp/PilA
MKSLLSKLLADNRGTTAIEYALIASLISLAIIGTLMQIGPLIEANFQTAADALVQ